MGYPIYSRFFRHRSSVLAATTAALNVARISASGADAQAGNDTARSGKLNMAHAALSREAGRGIPRIRALPGKLYHGGRGAERSCAQAANRCHQAALLRHPVARHLPGRCLRRGPDVDREVSQASKAPVGGKSESRSGAACNCHPPSARRRRADGSKRRRDLVGENRASGIDRRAGREVLSPTLD